MNSLRVAMPTSPVKPHTRYTNVTVAARVECFLVIHPRTRAYPYARDNYRNESRPSSHAETALNAEASLRASVPTSSPAPASASGMASTPATSYTATEGKGNANASITQRQGNYGYEYEASGIQPITAATSAAAVEVEKMEEFCAAKKSCSTSTRPIPVVSLALEQHQVYRKRDKTRAPARTCIGSNRRSLTTNTRSQLSSPNAVLCGPPGHAWATANGPKPASPVRSRLSKKLTNGGSKSQRVPDPTYHISSYPERMPRARTEIARLNGVIDALLSELRVTPDGKWMMTLTQPCMVQFIRASYAA